MALAAGDCERLDAWATPLELATPEELVAAGACWLAERAVVRAQPYLAAARAWYPAELLVPDLSPLLDALADAAAWWTRSADARQPASDALASAATGATGGATAPRRTP